MWCVAQVYVQGEWVGLHASQVRGGPGCAIQLVGRRVRVGQHRKHGIRAASVGMHRTGKPKVPVGGGA